METPNKEIKIDLPPEQAGGTYSNFAVISHGPNEFFFDFITMAPNMQQARVQSRIVMTPENAKNLLGALMDNVKRYEQMFGEITHKQPRQQRPVNGNGEIPNPFMNGGNA